MEIQHTLGVSHTTRSATPRRHGLFVELCSKHDHFLRTSAPHVCCNGGRNTNTRNIIDAAIMTEAVGASIRVYGGDPRREGVVEVVAGPVFAGGGGALLSLPTDGVPPLRHKRAEFKRAAPRRARRAPAHDTRRPNGSSILLSAGAAAAPLAGRQTQLGGRRRRPSQKPRRPTARRVSRPGRVCLRWCAGGALSARQCVSRHGDGTCYFHYTSICTC